MQTSDVLYHEVQRPNQLWIRLLVIALAAAAWGVFLYQIVLGQPFTGRPPPDGAVWVFWGVLGLILPLFLGTARLSVTLRGDTLTVRWFPLARRVIRVDQIAGHRVRDYRPLLEYGGWGIRWFPGRGMAYTMRGSRGVQLELRSGKRLLVGSDTPERLDEALVEAGAPPGDA